MMKKVIMLLILILFNSISAFAFEGTVEPVTSYPGI